MHSNRLNPVLSLLLPMCLCAAVSAQQIDRIESMKLLTPQVGWVATNQKLFWTTDDGAEWKDITPKLNHKKQAISSVFFLDVSRGWALLTCSDGADARADEVCFEFASTTTAGESWSVVHPKIVSPSADSPYPSDGVQFSGSTYIDFSDPQHGWAILKQNTSVLNSSGDMLRTTDGGQTWTQLAKGYLPIAGPFRFVTAKNGWMAGGPDRGLYVTHDAGVDWAPVTVEPPAQAPAAAYYPIFDLPTFRDSKHGVLPVTYSGTDQGNATLALFSTEDAGTTWKLAAALPIKNIYGGPVPSAVTGEKFLDATADPTKDLSLRTTSLYTAKAATTIARAAVSSVPVGISFASDSCGWLQTASSLLATCDGGHSWSDIAPDRRTGVQHSKQCYFQA